MPDLLRDMTSTQNIISKKMQLEEASTHKRAKTHTATVFCAL